MMIYLNIGIASIILGTLILVFRTIIRSRLLSVLSSRQTFVILTLIIVLTWLIAIGAISSYFIKKGRIQYIVEKAYDEIDFRDWRPVVEKSQYPDCTELTSHVKRKRLLSIYTKRGNNSDFKDRHGTSGCKPLFESELAAMQLSPPIIGRTNYEITVLLGKENFDKTGIVDMEYSLIYRNAYRSATDNWVSKELRHRHLAYEFCLKFPEGQYWKKIRVAIIEPSATEPSLVAEFENDRRSNSFNWKSPVGKELEAGTKLFIYFLWPPFTGEKNEF